MINLKKDDFKLCASMMRQPYGQALHQMLKQQLEEVNLQMRTATGDVLSWRQGTAQCLGSLIYAFENGDDIAQKFK